MFSKINAYAARARCRRGAAIYMTFMVLMIFSISGLALAARAMSGVRLTRFQEEGSVAFNLAESGADRAILWLRQRGAPPSQVAPFNPFGGTVALGAGTYTVVIDGDDANPKLDLKRYIVRSVGEVGQRRETVELFVQQSNFGRYAYFTDRETSSITGDVLWFKEGDVIDGPAHSNNADGTQFHINWTGSTQPIFKETLTSAGPGITWAPAMPGTEEEFSKVFQQGSSGYQLNVGTIELPANSDKQRRAAWGGSTGLPGSEGVYINSLSGSPVGGIYVVGDAAVEFKYNGTTTQIVEITTASGKKTRIEVNRSAGTTTYFDPSGNKHILNGLPNGTIYSTGNITSLKGELSDSVVSDDQVVSRNAWTVAVDLAAGKKVTITDNLRYHTTPDKTLPWDNPTNLKAACLGVVARNIELDENCPTDLTVHGVMLAGARDIEDGSFYNEGWNSKAVGRLTLVGGIIQKARGPVGTFDGSTGAQKTGYSKAYTYDTRMAVNPPPFFPTTGNYDRLSWKRTGAEIK